MDRLFYFSILFLSLLLINCAEEKKDRSQTNTIGLLGIASGIQTNSGSENGEPGGVLPPIPPVVGLPAAPGQPLNAPLLNDPQIHLSSAPVADDPAGIYSRILIDNISFQLPIHNQTTITAYFGKRNMRLELDGTVVNANNYYTLTPISPNPGGFIWFIFTHRSNQKFKIILVARNEFGSSSKEINFSDNRDCIGAPLVPAIVGDCNDHCLEVANVAGELVFKAKYKHGILTLLQLDIYVSSPGTGQALTEPKVFYYESDTFNPTLPTGVTTINTKLLNNGNEYMCMELQSYVVADDGNGNVDDRLLYGPIRLE